MDVGRGFKIYYAQEKCIDIRIPSGNPSSTAVPTPVGPMMTDNMNMPNFMPTMPSIPTMSPANPTQMNEAIMTRRSLWSI